MNKDDFMNDNALMEDTHVGHNKQQPYDSVVNTVDILQDSNIKDADVGKEVYTCNTCGIHADTSEYDLSIDGYDMTSAVYFDYQASTPCDERVVQAMMPFLRDIYGNPHARSHVFGWTAEKALEYARTQVATSINALPETIIFTSGATESNNLAIKGLSEFWKQRKKHIISTEIEHKCALECVKHLQRQGFEVTYVKLKHDGMIDLDDLKAQIRPDTLMMTIAAVNHEIGTIQPMEEIGKICKKHDIFLHVDAAQAWGKIEIDVEKWNVDLMSLSGHKTYGPKGIGVLYLRCKPRRVRIHPLYHGGGQERGFRSGTMPVFLCIGLGKAAELFCNKANIDSEFERIYQLHNFFINTMKTLPHIHVNGPDISSNVSVNIAQTQSDDKAHSDNLYNLHNINDTQGSNIDTPILKNKRIPHNVNISIAGIEGESLMMYLKEYAFSSGSACTSANLEPSYTLKAIGVSEDLLHSSVRISFGRQTTQEQVEIFANKLIKAIEYLRSISPVWDCIVEGRNIDSFNIDVR